MAKYKILDTGYANKGSNGTKETTAPSGGTAITLDVLSINVNANGMNGSEPYPAKFVDQEVINVGQESPSINISGVLKREAAGINATIKSLFDMRGTKGLKAFYYDDTSDIYSSNNIINAIGQTKSEWGATNATIGSSVKYVYCFVTNIRFDDGSGTSQAGGLLRFQMTLKLTNPQ